MCQKCLDLVGFCFLFCCISYYLFCFFSWNKKYSWDIAGASGTQAMAYIPFTLNWSYLRETLPGTLIYHKEQIMCGKVATAHHRYPGQQKESSRGGRQGPGGKNKAAHVTNFTYNRDSDPFPGQYWCTFKYPIQETVSDWRFLCSLATPNSSKISCFKAAQFH